MKVTAILDEIVPIQSAISNAVISFEEMTVSAVIVVTDVVRHGKPVVGLGFHSNGRYAQRGILRERLIPRLLNAKPESLHIAAGLGLGGNESYPGVFQPFGGFADTVPVEDGRVRLPDAPGIGIELKVNLMEVFSRMMG